MPSRWSWPPNRCQEQGAFVRDPRRARMASSTAARIAALAAASAAAGARRRTLARPRPPASKTFIGGRGARSARPHDTGPPAASIWRPVKTSSSGAPGPDELRQTLRATRPGDHADPDLGLARAGRRPPADAGRPRARAPCPRPARTRSPRRSRPSGAASSRSHAAPRASTLGRTSSGPHSAMALMSAPGGEDRRASPHHQGAHVVALDPCFDGSRPADPSPSAGRWRSRVGDPAGRPRPRRRPRAVRTPPMAGRCYRSRPAAASATAASASRGARRRAGSAATSNAAAASGASAIAHGSRQPADSASPGQRGTPRAGPRGAPGRRCPRRARRRAPLPASRPDREHRRVTTSGSLERPGARQVALAIVGGGQHGRDDPRPRPAPSAAIPRRSRRGARPSRPPPAAANHRAARTVRHACSGSRRGRARCW